MFHHHLGIGFILEIGHALITRTYDPTKFQVRFWKLIVLWPRDDSAFFFLSLFRTVFDGKARNAQDCLFFAFSWECAVNWRHYSSSCAFYVREGKSEQSLVRKNSTVTESDVLSFGLPALCLIP